MKKLLPLVYLFILSCAKPDKAFDQFKDSDIISLTDSITVANAPRFTANANGYDLIYLKVVVDKRVAETDDITLKTTSGKFVESNTTSLTTKAKLDGSLIVTLLAPITPGSGTVTAEIRGRKTSATVNFNEISVDSIIKINVSTTIVADGYTSTPFTVTVPAGSPLVQNSVTITTSAGFFESANAATVSVKPDVAGNIPLTLKSPEKAGTGYISVEAGGLKATKTIQFMAATVTTLLGLDYPTTGEADGTHPSSITVTVPINSDLSRNSLTMRTTAGTFNATGTNEWITKPNSDGKVFAQLKAPVEPTTAYITVETTPATARRTISINFTKAYPDTILVDPGAFSMKAGINEQITVSAQLVRRQIGGTPSRGTEVQFQAFDSTGNQTINQGQFRAISLSDITGKATAIYTPGNTSYRGRTIIRASVETPTKNAKGIGYILIVNP